MEDYPGGYATYETLYNINKDEDMFKYSGYELISVIGSGFFGRVWRARRLFDDKIIALKTVTVQNEQMLMNLDRETKILTKISYPVCQPFLVCFNDYKYFPKLKEFIIDMNLIEGKSLIQYSETQTDKKFRHLLLIMKDIIKALKYLHDHNIIHNDVKPDNIIIDKNLTPILVDFGVACSDLSVCSIDSKKLDCCQNVLGPNMYISPETLKTKSYFKESDVWSLGLSFYVAATNTYPFNNKVNTEILYDSILKDTPVLKTDNSVLNEIVNRCLDKNVITRITLNQISEILSKI